VSEDVVEHEGIGQGHERDLHETLDVSFALVHLLELSRGDEPVA
jgi:hypothetical protein